MNFFTKILLQCIGLTKLFCAINHAMEDLQQALLVLLMWFVQSTMLWRICNIAKILDYSKCYSLHCLVKMERARERRKDSDGGENSIGWEEKEKQKSIGNPGWCNSYFRRLITNCLGSPPIFKHLCSSHQWFVLNLLYSLLHRTYLRHRAVTLFTTTFFKLYKSYHQTS